MKLKWNGKVPVIIRSPDLDINMKIVNNIFEVDEEKGEKLIKLKGFEKHG